MLINENGAQQWRKMLTENFNLKDSEKLDWVSQYAAIHEIHESQLGVNSGFAIPNAANGSVNPLYATPLNTTGMGNVAAPENPNAGSMNLTAQGNFYNQKPGSGDIPVSTLPMALNIALMTIGLELVPVIPAKGPWVMLSYMDFPYAGGKLGKVNETAFDGKGLGKENKPIYLKIALPFDSVKEIRSNAEVIPNKAIVTVTNTTDNLTLVGMYKGIGRMDAGILVEIDGIINGAASDSASSSDSSDAAVSKYADNISINDVFGNPEASFTVNITKAADPAYSNGILNTGSDLATPIEVKATGIKADFVQTSADLVDGFANFATGDQTPMTRAQNETGTGNVIGLRLFSKWVQVGSYEVTGTVTRQQLQDLPLYGVDAVGKVMEALQNEITQHINQRILERVFRNGVTNAVVQLARQGVDLNLYIGASMQASKNLKDFGIKEYTDVFGNDHINHDVPNQEALTSAENTSTRQRRIASRILAAANLIQTVGRRGRATWVVTNTQVATALQDVAGYIIAPMVNNMAQDGSQNLYLGGTLAGLKVYVDPYMDWKDTRICVGRKGDANSPGTIFCPYILADTVSITAEGTMAPKMLVNSRFAIADIGFYPWLMYYTFAVYSDFGLV